MVNRRHVRLRNALWITLLGLPLSAGAMESPLETVRTTIERATTVLQNPAYQGRDLLQVRVQKVREVVEPQFDVQEIAKRTLGTYWSQRTEAERKEFIRLFTELVQKTYSGMLDRYTTNVRFFYDQERIDDKFAEVDTRIFDPTQHKAFVVTYKMHQVDNEWLIYDVVAENVSMVRNYRNQFSRIISKSSYQDLLQALQTKIQELDSTPQLAPAQNASAS